jgi:hypothetical protein
VYPRRHAAALAAGGHGKDAATLGEQERAGLRRQALTWLRADLGAGAALTEKAAPLAILQKKVVRRVRTARRAVWEGERSRRP